MAKIKAAIEAIDEVDGQPLQLSVSVGVAIYPDDGKSYATLIKRAEQATESAKLKGRGGAEFFSSLQGPDMPEDFFIVQGLNHALEAGQLHLEYQPIVDIRTGRPVKAEALLRWEHPTLGRVSPAVFIPLAEKYGIIRKLSRWVLRQALADLARWTSLFGMHFQVSINRSSHDFDDYEECHTEMREALIGKTVMDLDYLPQETRTRFEQDAVQAMEGERKVHREVDLPYADGELHHTLF